MNQLPFFFGNRFTEISGFGRMQRSRILLDAIARFLKEEVDNNSLDILSIALLPYLKSIGCHSFVTVCVALRF